MDDLRSFSFHHYLYLTFILLVCHVLSGTTQAAPILLSTHSSQMGNHLDVLEDQQHQFTINDIQKNTALDFKPLFNDLFASGPSNAVYWFKGTIVNDQISSNFWLILESIPTIVEVFLFKDGELSQRIHGGANLAVNKRPIAHRNQMFPLFLERNQEYQLVIKITSQGAVRTDFQLLTPEEAFLQVDQQSLFQGMFIGVMLIMLFYNLVLWTYIRDNIYLYYIAFVLCSTSYFSNLFGLPDQFLWPAIETFRAGINLIQVAFIICFAALFIRALFESKERFPILDRTILLLAAMALINGMTFLTTGFAAGPMLMSCLLLIYTVLASIIAMKSLSRIPRQATLFIIGWFAYFSGTSILALEVIGIIPGSYLSLHLAPIGSMIEAVVFSLALASRIKLLQSERDELKQERSELMQNKPYAMIVEDDPVSQRMLTKMLSSLNYQPVVACDGQRALDLLSNHPWSIIFMDCQMPIMDGLTATSEIRAAGDEYEQTPIIALSSNSSRGVEKRCLQAGIDDYLCKPLSLEKIKWLINKHNPSHLVN